MDSSCIELESHSPVYRKRRGRAKQAVLDFRFWIEELFQYGLWITLFNGRTVDILFALFNRRNGGASRCRPPSTPSTGARRNKMRRLEVACRSFAVLSGIRQEADHYSICVHPRTDALKRKGTLV